jgi:hypothetical protein
MSDSGDAPARTQSSLAKHIYEAVDRRIIQTDADIRRFEADLDKERKKYGLQSSKVGEGVESRACKGSSALCSEVELDWAGKKNGLQRRKVRATLYILRRGGLCDVLAF